MTACTHRLADGPLTCRRDDPHPPGRGCVYIADSLPQDGDTEARQEDQ